MISQQAALHLACTADKPELVKALLCAGADLNTLASQDGCAKPIWSANPGAVKTLLGQFPAHLNIKELRAGGTPAHWATEKPLLEGLLDLGCALEAHNCRGDTALHVMTKAKRLGCIVCLLSNGAEVIIQEKIFFYPICTLFRLIAWMGQATPPFTLLWPLAICQPSR